MGKWKEKLFDITVVEGIIYAMALAATGAILDLLLPWWDLKGMFAGWGVEIAKMIGDMAAAVRDALRPVA